MSHHLIEVFDHIPPEGPYRHPVTWWWTCHECLKPLQVSQHTFKQLEQRKLLAVKCKDCVPPPAAEGRLLQAA